MSRSLTNEIKRVSKGFKSKIWPYYEDYGYDKDEFEDEYRVEIVNENDEQRTLVYVYVELSVDECLDLADDLTPLIQKVSKDAYFDLDQPGVLVAVIWWDDIQELSDFKSYEPTREDQIKFGMYVANLLSAWTGVEFWASTDYDAETKTLTVQVESDDYYSENSMNLDGLRSYSDLKTNYSYDFTRMLQKNIVEN